MQAPNNSADKEKDEGIEDMGVGIDPMDELTTMLQDLQVKKPEVPAEPTRLDALQLALAQFEEKMKTAQARSRRHNHNQKLRIGMVHGKGVMKKKVMKALKKKAAERKKAKKAMKKIEKKADDEETKEEDGVQN